MRRDEVKKGDAVVFKWGEGELTGILVTPPLAKDGYETRYVRVRTRRTDYSIPWEDVLRAAPERKWVPNSPESVRVPFWTRKLRRRIG